MSFQDMLSMGQKSKKNYECLPLSTNKQEIMYDKKEDVIERSKRKRRISNKKKQILKLFKLRKTIKKVKKKVKFSTLI